VPLQTADRILGTLSISAGRPGAYRADDAYLLNEVAGAIVSGSGQSARDPATAGLRQQLDEQIHDWIAVSVISQQLPHSGVVQWSAGGGVSDANDVFLRMVGRTREEIRSGSIAASLRLKADYLGLRAHAEENFATRLL